MSVGGVRESDVLKADSTAQRRGSRAADNRCCITTEY